MDPYISGLSWIKFPLSPIGGYFQELVNEHLEVKFQAELTADDGKGLNPYARRDFKFTHSLHMSIQIGCPGT